MPLEFKRPPKLNGKTSSVQEKVQEPSLLRDIFEGIVDTGLGAVGVGPDSKSNRLGALLGMAIPTIGGKLGRFGNTALKTSDFPAQNRLAMGMTPGRDAIYDEAGRYLGAAPKIDPAFQAHVASSVGKFQPAGKLKIQNMEEAFLDKGIGGPTPSPEMIKQLIKKYTK